MATAETAVTYSTLLFQLEDDGRAPVRFEQAARLARRFEARLVGLSCRRPASWIGVPGAEYMGGESPTLEASRAGTIAATREAAFLRQCDQAQLRAFEVVTTDDDASRALAVRSRCADLVVLGQAEPEDGHYVRQRDLVDRLLEDAAAPTLLIPYAGRFDTLGDNVLIAWGDNRECARAIADAMPFLKSARAVHVVMFDTSLGDDGAIDGSRLDPVVRWLAEHGVKARPSVAFTRSDIGNALLSRAADVGADLLVMGAWSHSRLAERVFGGVTRTVLDAMTVPVLMSH